MLGSKFETLFGEKKPKTHIVKILSLFIILYFTFTLIQETVINYGIDFHPSVVVLVSSVIVYAAWLGVTYALNELLKRKGV